MVQFDFELFAYLLYYLFTLPSLLDLGRKHLENRVIVTLLKLSTKCQFIRIGKLDKGTINVVI
jgi:hypothetical protein